MRNNLKIHSLLSQMTENPQFNNHAKQIEDEIEFRNSMLGFQRQKQQTAAIFDRGNRQNFTDKIYQLSGTAFDLIENSQQDSLNNAEIRDISTNLFTIRQPILSKNLQSLDREKFGSEKTLKYDTYFKNADTENYMDAQQQNEMNARMEDKLRKQLGIMPLDREYYQLM